jgi:2-polyprenyl-6-methoxyphenol hydroxylase-like FAD-dependent oxidoreductase
MSGTAAPRVAVIGAGLAGLATALLLRQAGLSVVVVEGDEGYLPSTPAEGARWNRPGVPHLHQTHGFLGAFHALLRERLPGVLRALVGAGAVEQDFGADAAARGYDPGNGPDIAILFARRSTVEWAFRRALAGEPGIALLTGARVTEVCADAGTVTGVRTDGGFIQAEIVIDASGRRRQPWAGCYQSIDDREGQLAYITSFYELERGAEPGPLTRVGGAGVIGDGYHTVINVHDNRTFSAVIACSPRDRALLAARDGGLFEAFMRAVPITGPWLDPDRARQLRPPAAMSNMRNRLSAIRPSAPAGFFAVGDALCTTDPARGYGASMAVLGAAVLADAIVGCEGDYRAARQQTSAWADTWVSDWYYDTVAHTAVRAARWQALLDGADAAHSMPVGRPVPAFAAFQVPALDEAGWWLRRRYSQMMTAPRELAAAFAASGPGGKQLPDNVQTVMEDVPTRADLLAVLAAGPDRERDLAYGV